MKSNNISRNTKEYLLRIGTLRDHHKATIPNNTALQRTGNWRNYIITQTSSRWAGHVKRKGDQRLIKLLVWDKLQGEKKMLGRLRQCWRELSIIPKNSKH